MTRAIAKTRSFISIYAKPLALGLLTTSFVFLAFYVYAVNQTVRNVMNRQVLESELSHLSADLGELEFKHITLKNSINLSFAQSVGFQSVGETKFVSRQSSVAAASPFSARQ